MAEDQPCIELAFLPLPADSNAGDPTSTAGAAVKLQMEDAAKEQAVRYIKHSPKHEDPDTVVMVLLWDSLSAHEAFQSQPGYDAFTSRLTKLASNDPRPWMWHFNHPNPLPPLETAATEVMVAYFALPVSKETESFVLDRVQKFFDVSSPISPTFKAYAGGWVLEEVEHKSLGEGKKGRAFVGFLGWDSVQEHMDFRETETFKEHIPLIRTMGHVGIEMFHVIRGA